MEGNESMSSESRPGSDRPSRPGSERPLQGSLQSFDLESEASRLREEEAWREGKRNSITLRKGEGMNVVLLVMKAGDGLEEHSAPGPFSLSVQQGHIRFGTTEDSLEADAGTLLTCDAGVHHTVEALDDAVCLLTVAGSGWRSRPESSE